jgi:hypothetical protein
MLLRMLCMVWLWVAEPLSVACRVQQPGNDAIARTLPSTMVHASCAGMKRGFWNLGQARSLGRLAATLCFLLQAVVSLLLHQQQLGGALNVCCVQCVLSWCTVLGVC